MSVAQQDLVLVGGGGHCRSCMDVIEGEGRFRIRAIIDRRERIGQSILTYRVSHCDQNLSELVQPDVYFLVTFGQIRSADKRSEYFERITSLGGKFAVITATTAQVSIHAEILDGSIIMHQALVNTSARVGRNCIINSKALLEHDVILADHCHVSTGAVLNGGVSVGSRCFIGSRAVLVQGITICEDVIIGAGSVVLRDITVPGVYVGHPVRRLSSPGGSP
jgi:sugar O-acyltransferase (sialic acid O-acetyltransferase NeuD family)